MTIFVNTEYRIMAGAGDIAGFANQIEIMGDEV